MYIYGVYLCAPGKRINIQDGSNGYFVCAPFLYPTESDGGIFNILLPGAAPRRAATGCACLSQYFIEIYIAIYHAHTHTSGASGVR